MKNILLVQKKILPLQTFCIVRAIRVRKRASFLGKYGRNGKFDFLKGVKVKRTMKINVNVFIGSAMCVLIIAVIGGLYRMNKDQDTWRPGDLYSQLGNGASYSSVTSTSSDNADKVLVSMRGGRVLGSSRSAVSAPVSYAHASSASIANSQSPIANSSTGALYTTSSATIKSFGGGNMQNGGSMSMSGGSVRNSQLPIANSQSPITNSQSLIANSQSPISNSQSSIAPDAEALIAAAAYTPMGSSMYGIGSMSALGGGYAGIGGRMSGPRRIPGTGIGWDILLNGMTGEGDPFLYEDDEGVRYYDEAALRAWFEANKDNFPGVSWDEFLAQFFNPSTKHAFPVGEPWVLLILALGYVGYMLVRSARTRARGV